MERNIYVMVDSVSGMVAEPFVMANDAELKRMFKPIAQSGSVPIHVLRDTVVFHLGKLVADTEVPRIDPAPWSNVVLRGDAYVQYHPDFKEEV